MPASESKAGRIDAAAGVVIDIAVEDDLPAIVALHAADAIGGHGDAWTAETGADYLAAFATLRAHPDHTLYVARHGGAVVGTLLLSLLPGLTGRGMLHAQLRSVQVRADLRSLGIGARMVAFAEDAARARGAGVVELTSNLRRTQAHRFYERLGYAKSHAGFKKRLG
ncbi:MAG: GNAT family N-acetyltransferase [Alsobacter sp.]